MQSRSKDPATTWAEEAHPGSPLLTPTAWNLYIVLLFGFFPTDISSLLNPHYFTKSFRSP